MAGVWSLVKLITLLSLCACVLSETTTGVNTVKKSRKKRRGCKCLTRAMHVIDREMDKKLKEFKDIYLLPTLKERKSHEAKRMHDAMLRLSGDVAETKNALRLMTGNIEQLYEDLSKTQKDYVKITSKFNRLGASVANISKYVDSIQERISQQSAVEVTTLSDEGSKNKKKDQIPRQCQDVADDGGMRFKGEYYIYIKPYKVEKEFKALCKMVNNSGWTVIQRRLDGSVDFYRGWEDYRKGFGTMEGEFWIGLDNIHLLTAQEKTMLRIEMEDWSGKQYFAEYDHFKVAGASQNYRLSVSGYSGNAGDSMTSLWENHDGMQFSTKDKDNDLRYYDSCAQHYAGAWWFSNCFEAHLNGKYYHKGFHKNYFQRDGIQWNSIHMYSSLKAVQMMIKPTDETRNSARNPPPATNEVNSSP